MNRLFKKIMLWLLIAVLPVQGIAAATMASCAPLHKNALSHLVTTQEGRHHDMGVPSHHHDDEDAAPAMMHDHHDSAAGDHAGSAHKHGLSSCSACGDCCIGAALLPTKLSWSQDHISSEPVLTLPTSLIPSHISAGLERPPRIVLA